MTPQDSWTTRLTEYIANVLPWAHGHQLKGITTFVDAIIDKQTGIQAELVRGLGNQEAALKRLSRLLHNPRLAPQRLADAVLVQADRGFADVALVEVLTELGVEFIMRVKGSTKVYFQGQWRPLRTLCFTGNTRQRTLGRRAYCESAPHRLWITLSRARDHQGQWDTWYLISNRCRRAHATATEYARRFGCEQGFRDTKWELGFAQARIKDIHAWSRLFALFALALLVVVSLAMKLLAAGGPAAVILLRRVASRRPGRWDLSIVSAMGRLVRENKALLAHLSSHMQFNLDARLIYVG